MKPLAPRPVVRAHWHALPGRPMSALTAMPSMCRIPSALRRLCAVCPHTDGEGVLRAARGSDWEGGAPGRSRGVLFIPARGGEGPVVVEALHEFTVYPRARGEHLRAFAAADVTNDEDRDILRDKADSLLAVGGSTRFTF